MNTTNNQNPEQSFKQDISRPLVQMTTGCGKTFTAISSAYHPFKHAKVRRILFLVDTKILFERIRMKKASQTKSRKIKS